MLLVVSVSGAASVALEPKGEAMTSIRQTAVRQDQAVRQDPAVRNDRAARKNQAVGPELAGCTPESRITKTLLGYGVIAGPLYVVVALSQALTRDGFDLSRHAWSLLALGGPGWIQIANLILTGLMTVAFAVGLRRVLGSGTGSRWAPRLVATYGVSLVVAGIFRADPTLGFPVGTPAGQGAVSWHGMVHLAAGAIGFTALTIGCFVLARRYTAEARRGWAVICRITGVAFLAGFVAVASGGGSASSTLAFTAAVVLVCGWSSAVAVDRYAAVDAAR